MLFKSLCNINEQTFDSFHILEDICVNTQKSMNTDININDWVLVNYFGEFFPGKITDLKGDTVCVSCLQKQAIISSIQQPQICIGIQLVTLLPHYMSLSTKTLEGFTLVLLKKR